MNKHQFNSLFHSVFNNILWSEAHNHWDSKNLKKHLEKKHKFKFIPREQLLKEVEQLKGFDINKLWDKSFWGLTESESISAVASEPYHFVKALQENRYKI